VVPVTRNSFSPPGTRPKRKDCAAMTPFTWPARQLWWPPQTAPFPQPHNTASLTSPAPSNPARTAERKQSAAAGAICGTPKQRASASPLPDSNGQRKEDTALSKVALSDLDVGIELPGNRDGDPHASRCEEATSSGNPSPGLTLRFAVRADLQMCSRVSA
jgi:hypothetical protein